MTSSSYTFCVCVWQKNLWNDFIVATHAPRALTATHSALALETPAARWTCGKMEGGESNSAIVKFFKVSFGLTMFIVYYTLYLLEIGMRLLDWQALATGIWRTPPQMSSQKLLLMSSLGSKALQLLQRTVIVLFNIFNSYIIDICCNKIILYWWHSEYSR